MTTVERRFHPTKRQRRVTGLLVCAASCCLVPACGGTESPHARGTEPVAKEQQPHDLPEARVDREAAYAAAQEGPYLVVLGIAQDAGIPQVGSWNHPGWSSPPHRRRVASLGLVDPASGQRWLFDATPDLRDQLHTLASLPPDQGQQPGTSPVNGGLSGVFLTHAHMGHYAGLLFLGHESMGARGVSVYAMPRFASYLASNGPWDQLVRYSNIEVQQLADGVSVSLGETLAVTPLLVPHRQEYSEVVGFRIAGPERSALYVPDIDSWEDWDASGVRLEDVLDTVDVAFLDATFFADGEIPGRDMSGFPHPFIRHTMERVAASGRPELAKKIRFIHLNHTNPAQYSDHPARAELEEAGFRVAREGEIVSLSLAR